MPKRAEDVLARLQADSKMRLPRLWKIPEESHVIGRTMRVGSFSHCAAESPADAASVL